MICPIEFRYGRDIVKHIFSEEQKYRYMLDVEMALMYAYYKLGILTKHEYLHIKRSTKSVKLEVIKDIEQKIKHDVMALVLALSEKAGISGRLVHLGATSNDIIDTATALQLKSFCKILESDLFELEDVLIEKAQKYKNSMMLGRTHGQWALPITFGLKLAVYLDEIHRHTARVHECKKRVIVGKIAGAVGTSAGFGAVATKLQKLVQTKLKITLARATSQIVGRDRYIELVSVLANIATTLEKMATEIRNLQRPEIGEVSEKFEEKTQVGSSTMAHKQNPIMAENICSLARIIRGFVVSMHESAVLWHERDLTNSAAERFIIPHTCILIDDILTKTSQLFRTLAVHETKMLENLNSAKFDIMDEPVIVALTLRGMSRQHAHELVRRAAMSDERLDQALMKIPEITNLLTPAELEKLMMPETYLGKALEIVDLVTTSVQHDRETLKRI